MATAYVSTLKLRGADGWATTIPCTCSDVAAAGYVMPDGSDNLNVPFNHGVIALVDVILSAAGADTTNSEIYVNGKNTGQKVLNAVNVATSINRQFQGTPIYMAPGSNLKIVQRA